MQMFQLMENNLHLLLITTVDISVTPILTGQEIATAAGVIDPADQVIGLTGLGITSTQGTAVAPNEDVSVTGFEITSAQGTSTVDTITVV
jgi:hypothetical protein